MIFETSGSTGEPKRVQHISALLRREAAFFLQLLGNLPGKPGRVVRFVPPQHLYGYIFGVLLPELAGVKVFDARTYYGGYHPVRFEAGDVVVAAPHQWRWLLDRTHAFPESLQGVTSTAQPPPELFGKISMLDVYGSTETSGVGYRSSGDEPYELLPWWDSRDARLDQNDILRWVGPRRFFVHGRRDGAVQISGMNLYPAVIERRLRESCMVAACAVRLMRPEEGRRLKAFIVLRADAERTAFEAWVSKTFEGPEEIAALRYGEQLPLTPDGKNADW